jgi:hypothetical protein
LVNSPDEPFHTGVRSCADNACVAAPNQIEVKLRLKCATLGECSAALGILMTATVSGVTAVGAEQDCAVQISSTVAEKQHNLCPSCA